MRTYDDMLIRVQSRWNDWCDAQIRLADLHDVHWLQQPRAPRPLVHGYISCSQIVAGDLPHGCDLSPAPHRLHVCVLKGHTIPAVYAELARRADERTAAWNGGIVPARGYRTPTHPRRL
jgi:hypothetical protein